MKRLSLTVIIALAAIVAAQAQTSKPPAGCHALGVTTYTFYGDRATVAKAIDRMPREMSRVVTVLIESNEAAEFQLFERQEGRTAVYSWSVPALETSRKIFRR